jgi:hypothetical protein
MPANPHLPDRTDSDQRFHAGTVGYESYEERSGACSSDPSAVG